MLFGLSEPWASELMDPVKLLSPLAALSAGTWRWFPSSARVGAVGIKQRNVSTHLCSFGHAKYGEGIFSAILALHQKYLQRPTLIAENIYHKPSKNRSAAVLVN